MAQNDFNLSNKTPAELGGWLIEECQKPFFDFKADRVQKILTAGADVTAADAKGKTALMYCVLNNHTALMKNLLTHKDIQIDQQDTMGRSAFFHAMYWRKPAAAKYLRDQGADMTLEDITGMTARNWAEKFSRFDMVAIVDGKIPPKNSDLLGKGLQL